MSKLSEQQRLLNRVSAGWKPDPSAREIARRAALIRREKHSELVDAVKDARQNRHRQNLFNHVCEEPVRTAVDLAFAETHWRSVCGIRACKNEDCLNRLKPTERINKAYCSDRCRKAACAKGDDSE